ncbi:hypothetical protein [Microbacterium sp. gxy059]|uniref:hypothetical protein n=1 Tax=Microbacterium sp. gxy059 TaxID=2957199 RepID=UPI003D96C6F5
MTDYDDLIAEARNRTTTHAARNPEGSRDLELRLADALEAAERQASEWEAAAHAGFEGTVLARNTRDAALDKLAKGLEEVEELRRQGYPVGVLLRLLAGAEPIHEREDG